MRRAILRVAPDFLADILGKGTGASQALDAPADMKIIDVRWEHAISGGEVWFKVESPGLPDIPLGEHLPHIDITHRHVGPYAEELSDMAAKLKEWAAEMSPEGECSSPTDES